MKSSISEMTENKMLCSIRPHNVYGSYVLIQRYAQPPDAAIKRASVRYSVIIILLLIGSFGKTKLLFPFGFTAAVGELVKKTCLFGCIN